VIHEDATVVVVGAGYAGKRRILARVKSLGVRLVIVDEPGHWSAALVDEGIADEWVGSPVTGNADTDAAAASTALAVAGVEPDAVVTFWEDSICTAVRVAASLGLACNPPEVVDAARSKVRMRERSAELGLPTPRARRVRSLDELYAAASVVGFPAVVKPEFGASAVGCVRVDSLDELPTIYSLVREVVTPDHDGIFRMGNDLLLEEYLDGVEFDVDLVMHEGRCVFSSVSQNWPTNEPSFQETGLHCPPDHDRKAVKMLVELAISHAERFGLHHGVLHIEGKCTSRGPRIVEINCRLGGGRIHEFIERVWGVDLVEAQVRASLGLPPALRPAKKPLCAIANVIVHSPASGRLASSAMPLEHPHEATWWQVDHELGSGDEVVGPEAVFATVVADVNIAAKDLKTAHALARRVLAHPPTVVPLQRDPASEGQRRAPS
jgi:biotin carboxylase